MLIHTRDNEYHPRLTAWGCSAPARSGQGGFWPPSSLPLFSS